jgi:hypothetical protein
MTRTIKPLVTRQSGSVISEYAITTSVITALLFLPIPGLGESVIHILIQSFNSFQNHSTVLLSMP